VLYSRVKILLFCAFLAVVYNISIMRFFDATFFKFVFGFTAMLLLGFLVLAWVGYSVIKKEGELAKPALVEKSIRK
jgi:hypothetical protein